jgi:hypothetical protein
MGKSDTPQNLRSIARALEKVPDLAVKEVAEVAVKEADARKGSSFSHGKYRLGTRVKVGKESTIVVGVPAGFWAIKNAGQRRVYAGFARMSGDRRWANVYDATEKAVPRVLVGQVSRAVNR